LITFSKVSKFQIQKTRIKRIETMRRRKTVVVKAWDMNLNIRENHIREEEL